MNTWEYYSGYLLLVKKTKGPLHKQLTITLSSQNRFLHLDRILGDLQETQPGMRQITPADDHLNLQ
jgi:hypothetical protein